MHGSCTHYQHRGCAQLLGRAEDARAYVRHGAEEGFTEITLSGGAGERAVKVYHLIRAKGDRVSEWKLNGDPYNLYPKPKKSPKLLTLKASRRGFHGDHAQRRGWRAGGQGVPPDPRQERPGVRVEAER